MSIKNRFKIIKRKVFDIGKGSCSFSSMSYCIIDESSCSYGAGHYRFQLSDCNNIYFYSDSNIRRVKKIVTKLIDCIIKSKLLIESNKNITRSWNIDDGKYVVFSQRSNTDIVFKITNSKKVIKLDNNETYVREKKTYFMLHATNIVVEDFNQNYVDNRNKKHLLLRLDRLEHGLNDFIKSIDFY